MTEPIATTAATIATAAAAVPVLTLFGIPLGLHADVLLAGFAGAVAAMGLLNSVPSSGDTLRELMRTSMRRVGVAVGSAVTAGYLTPLVGLISNLPPSLNLAIAFVVGAGAQSILPWVISVTTKNRGAA